MTKPNPIEEIIDTAIAETDPDDLIQNMRINILTALDNAGLAVVPQLPTQKMKEVGAQYGNLDPDAPNSFNYVAEIYHGMLATYCFGALKARRYAIGSGLSEIDPDIDSGPFPPMER